MRADELGLCLFATAFIKEESASNQTLVNLLKLVDVVKKQFVGFGYFKLALGELLKTNSELFQSLSENHIKFIATVNYICESNNVTSTSPLGLIIAKNILVLEQIHVYEIRELLDSYHNWMENCELNPIPMILSPDALFSEFNAETILSPIPCYDEEVPLPTISDVEKIGQESDMALVYKALLHARQRKSSKALEEITEFCLKMSQSEEEGSITRSSIALAQICDILGLDQSSLFTVNESITTAKLVPDNSVLSAAVTLKSQIIGSYNAWRYAAALPDPHPIALVNVARLENDFSNAVMINATVAVNVFAPYVYDVARLSALTERTLPVLVLHSVRNCDWNKAAGMIESLNMNILEVRATAIAFAVVCFAVLNMKTHESIFRQDLYDLFEINLRHFCDVKPTIQAIANAYELESSTSVLSDKLYLLKGTSDVSKGLENIPHDCFDVRNVIHVLTE